MHDQPLNPENSPDELYLRELDSRLTRALDAQPDVPTPADFAARVASKVPARRPVSLKPTHYGDYALILGVLVALAALFVPLAHARGHYVFGVVESFLLAQFLILTIWLSLRRHRLH